MIMSQCPDPKIDELAKICKSVKKNLLSQLGGDPCLMEDVLEMPVLDTHHHLFCHLNRPFALGTFAKDSHFHLGVFVTGLEPAPDMCSGPVLFERVKGEDHRPLRRKPSLQSSKWIFRKICL